MRKKKHLLRKKDDYLWLDKVKEVRHAVNESHPIFGWEIMLRSADDAPPQKDPLPVKHPFCEWNFLLEGSMTQFIGKERIDRHGIDFMLLGPGTPHFDFRTSYPYRIVTIFFSPRVLLEMGPNGDGAWALSRFTAPRAITQKIIHPPPKLGIELSQMASEMAEEFTAKRRGFELRLSGLLMESLWKLLRWEDQGTKRVSEKFNSRDWAQLERVARYLYKHYSEQIYIEQIADNVGMTATRLRKMFRRTLGMSCSHYLQSLRLDEAKAQLSIPNSRVTEVALNVGFETLSHFITSFRSYTGMSPTQYVRSLGSSSSGPVLKRTVKKPNS